MSLTEFLLTVLASGLGGLLTIVMNHALRRWLRRRSARGGTQWIEGARSWYWLLVLAGTLWSGFGFYIAMYVPEMLKGMPRITTTST